MSETFSPFVPSSGSGPDPSIGEPRVVDMENCRLEAEGRIVTTPGFEEATIPGTLDRPCRIQVAGNGVTVQDTLGEGDSLFGIKRRIIDQDTGSELASIGSLTPLSIDILATSTLPVYSCRMGYGAGDSGALIVYSYASSPSISVLYWVKLDPSGSIEASGSVVVPGTNPGGTFRFFCLGEGLVFARLLINNAGTYESDEYILEYDTSGVAPTLTTRFHRFATAPSSPGSIGYAWLFSGTVYYRGIQTASPYNLTVAVNTSTWTSTTSAAISCGSTDYHRFSNPFFRSGIDTLSYIDTNTTPWSLVLNGVSRAFLGTVSEDWIANGIYKSPLKPKGAWTPGPLFFEESGGSISKSTIQVLWGRSAATTAENEAAWDSPYLQQISFREFCGPFIDIGATDGTVCFTGTQMEAPASFTNNKGIWLIEPNGGAIGNSGSTLKCIGSHGLDRISGYALLLYDPNVSPLEFTLVLLGQKTVESATVSLAIQRWKVTAPGKGTPELIRRPPAKDADSIVVPGSAPCRVSGQSYDEAWLRWPPAMSPRWGGGATGSAPVLACYCYAGFDSEGRYIRGPLSPVTTQVNFPAAGGGGNTWYVQAPPVTNKITGMRIELYRTATSGSTFYLIGTATDTGSMFDGGSGWGYVTDSQTDSTIVTRRLLYTQAPTGALSGRHETASMPPCRMFFRGTSRSIVGGLERPTTVQFSDEYLYGEITPWPTGPQWIVDVGENVVGVGEADGSYLVFTQGGIFAITGPGPDAMGDGAFDRPRKISGIEALSSASILQTNLGWVFQARDRQLYLIRNGNSSPECISLSSRSKTSGGDDRVWFDPDSVVVSSVFDPKENLAYFHVQNQGDSNHDRTIVFDFVSMQLSSETSSATGKCLPPLWMHNDLLHCLSHVDDELIEEGIVVARKRLRTSTDWWMGVRESSSDPDGTAHRKAQFKTSNLTPWGKTGWGRVREVSLSVDRDSASETSEEPNVATITLENDKDTETFNYLDADLLDNVVSLVPANQKCSELKLTVVDNSTPPMIWTGVNLSTTSAARTRVR